ncbi:hypothetical protein BGW36DRAFT_385395 [Talaromyces proteolyticus]|uniref:Zn(2)-C6 fungal-type domain-containing protein n=1 Tax=Talaromyces proteolyticus TaxID=1131652 RepID=A0AAD4KLB5_9EURO|nr:uncharacterized protein BGW36DRAFT_385395 [Talaromyces proteolyticus]KAH8692877.1 hypothetical protein BGW36DRAFT_385395 [Talaromyces proteolyticus]
MLRRRHKKSRRGCLTCRQRHVKCDERRPVCLLCTMSHRECIYAPLDPDTITSPASQASPSEFDHPQLQVQEHIKSPNNGLFHTPSVQNDSACGTRPSPDISSFVHSTSSLNPSQQLSPIHHTQPNQPGFTEIDAELNFNHMELIIHLLTDHDVFSLSLGDPAFSTDPGLSIGLKKGLEFPYLLYQCLAFSSLHLAFVPSDKSNIYRHQAASLQTRALSLFNSMGTEVDESNCVGVLLFSSILGLHLLTDTLAERTSGSLDAFVEKYVQCIEIHRGVYSIAIAAWPYLMKSDLEPVISSSSSFTSRTPTGDDCQLLSKLIESAACLGEEDKEACRRMIRYLQIGFDAVSTELEQGYRHYMIYTWLMLAPPKFTDLLTAKTPEAFVLLAYYAILLHYGRHLWQVGDAGLYIIRIIIEYLGPEWQTWLDFPRKRIMQESLDGLVRDSHAFLETVQH